MGSKHKEVTTGDKEVQWSFKKARGKQLGKYCGGANPYERCVSAGQDCLVHHSR